MPKPDNENVNNSLHFILASSSPRRSAILKQWNVPAHVVASHIKEEKKDGENPIQTVKRLAFCKALAVLNHIKHTEKKIIALGADTTVVLDGHILDKPIDENQAATHLSALAGKTHEVLTGYALVQWPDKVLVQDATVSKVTMHSFSKQEIQEYIQTGEPMDKAGAYAVQGIGGKFIEKVEGSMNNVIGLPIEDLMPWFRRLGII